jgi:hypothetical protein
MLIGKILGDFVKEILKFWNLKIIFFFSGGMDEYIIGKFAIYKELA